MSVETVQLLNQIEDQIQSSVSNLDFYLSLVDEMDDVTLVSKVRHYLKSTRIPLRQLSQLNQNVKLLRGGLENRPYDSSLMLKDRVTIRTLFNDSLFSVNTFLDEKQLDVITEFNGLQDYRVLISTRIGIQCLSSLFYFFYKICHGNEKLFVDCQVSEIRGILLTMYIEHIDVRSFLESIEYKSLLELSKMSEGSLSSFEDDGRHKLQFELPGN